LVRKQSGNPASHYLRWQICVGQSVMFVPCRWDVVIHMYRSFYRLNWIRRTVFRNGTGQTLCAYATSLRYLFYFISLKKVAREPGIFWFRLFSLSIALPLSHSGSPLGIYSTFWNENLLEKPSLLFCNTFRGVAALQCLRFPRKFLSDLPLACSQLITHLFCPRSEFPYECWRPRRNETWREAPFESFERKKTEKKFFH
jgi:hypothetical protein